jgi:uncharacterized protein (DUF58 family)
MTLVREREQELIARRLWYVLAGALAALSLWRHLPLALVAAFFALVIGLVPEIWYRQALRHLTVTQHLSMRRAFFGEEPTLDLVVENRKFLPLPWLEVEDEIPDQVELLSGHASPSYKVRRALLINAFSLWAFQRVTRRYRLRCTARGVFTFGPVQVRSSDPFGWLVRADRLSMAASATLLVYPLLAPLTAFGLSARRPFGELSTPVRLLEDPLRVAGVRDYVPGDDPRRIHWKATARTGEVRSKVYDPSSQYRLLLALDITSYLEPWMGIDPDMQELSIALTASLADWALDNGFAVGLLANTLAQADDIRLAPTAEPATILSANLGFARRVRIGIGRDTTQRERLLTALARLIPYFGSPMNHLLAAEARGLGIGTTVVFIGVARAVRVEVVAALLDLRRHGAAVHLILTGDPDEAVATDTGDLPVQRAGGREVWHALRASSGDAATSLRLD